VPVLVCVMVLDAVLEGVPELLCVMVFEDVPEPVCVIVLEDV